MAREKRTPKRISTSVNIRENVEPPPTQDVRLPTPDVVVGPRPDQFASIEAAFLARERTRQEREAREARRVARAVEPGEVLVVGTLATDVVDNTGPNAVSATSILLDDDDDDDDDAVAAATPVVTSCAQDQRPVEARRLEPANAEKRRLLRRRKRTMGDDSDEDFIVKRPHVARATKSTRTLRSVQPPTPSPPSRIGQWIAALQDTSDEDNSGEQQDRLDRPLPSAADIVAADEREEQLAADILHPLAGGTQRARSQEDEEVVDISEHSCRSLSPAPAPGPTPTSASTPAPAPVSIAARVPASSLLLPMTAPPASSTTIIDPSAETFFSSIKTDHTELNPEPAPCNSTRAEVRAHFITNWPPLLMIPPFVLNDENDPAERLQVEAERNTLRIAANLPATIGNSISDGMLPWWMHPRRAPEHHRWVAEMERARKLEEGIEVVGEEEPVKHAEEPKKERKKRLRKTVKKDDDEADEKKRKNKRFKRLL